MAGFCGVFGHRGAPLSNRRPLRQQPAGGVRGQFHLGGAGKTPVALKLASLLREAGRNPGFLTRGYGGSERGPHVIDAVADTAARVGDEPLLLARSAATVVSRDRPVGAKLLETLSEVRQFGQRHNPSPQPSLWERESGRGRCHIVPSPVRIRLQMRTLRRCKLAKASLRGRGTG